MLDVEDIPYQGMQKRIEGYADEFLLDKYICEERNVTRKSNYYEFITRRENENIKRMREEILRRMRVE